MLGNIFKLRKDWLICPSNNTATVTIPKPPINIEPQALEQPTTSSMVAPKAEKCGWEPNCPICKNLEEDWDGDHQKQFQLQQPQMQCPHTQNYKKCQNFQRSRSQTFDVPDRHSSQLKLCSEWEEEMERLNNKYGLNCFSDSELNSESDEGEKYRCEHNYETLL